MMRWPDKLTIETTTRCNADCRMCVRRHFKEEMGDMSLDIYRRLVSVFPGLSFVSLSGYGEPLLNHHIFEMIGLAKAHLPEGGQVGFNSNGMLVDAGIAEDLVRSGLDLIVISVDGACAETFNEIRKNLDFELILKNIELINSTKERLGSATPKIGFEMVAMKRNVGELPELVRLAHDCRVSFVMVSNLLPHSDDMKEEVLHDFNSDESVARWEEAKAEALTEDHEELTLHPGLVPYIYSLFGLPPLRKHLGFDAPWQRNLPEDQERVLKLLEKTIAGAEEAKVCLNFPRLLERNKDVLQRHMDLFNEAATEAKRYDIELSLPPLVPRTQRECGFIVNGAPFISWDGYVKPCNNLSHSYPCFINGRPKSITSVNFGNVLEQDFMEIWNSPEYLFFRSRVERFDMPPCGDCSFADGCYLINIPVFEKDCYSNRQPCGDCPWARGILQCL